MKALDIVGGVYREVIVLPEHVELLGSAGRAAVAIGPQRAAVTIHTALAPKDQNALKGLARANSFSIDVTDTANTVSFSYMHGLDPPRISPAPHMIHNKPTIAIKGARILCFGALDFDWHVTGEQVVYDPQDAFGAKPFSMRGSTAERLALVLNEYEARHITDEHNTKAILQKLFRIDNPEVVVLKCGAKGTIVSTAAGKVTTIPPLLRRTFLRSAQETCFQRFLHGHG